MSKTIQLNKKKFIPLQATLNKDDERTFEIEFHSATYHTMFQAARILKNILGHLRQVWASSDKVRFDCHGIYFVIGNIN